MTHLTEIELVMALDGEMEPRDAELAMRHMQLCAECRNEFEKLGGVSKRVEAYQQGLYSEKPLAADERRLRLIGPGVFSFPGWSWGLVAAVVLLGISVAFWNYSHTSNAHPAAQGENKRDKGGAQATVSEGEPNTRTFVAKNAPQDDKSLSGGKRKMAGAAAMSGIKPTQLITPKAKNTRQSTQQNAMNQFTELPFSDASLPLDDATVVRVELPAAALRQAGVPVEEDNASAMLQADVVLGVDGLPRGIRLVKNTNHLGTN